MASGSGPLQVVLLLLGERGSGKSSAGNSILGRAAFRGRTRRSSRKTASILGSQVTVVDTPGWLSGSPTPERVPLELCRALELCRPGPSAVLLLLPAHRPFTGVEWGAMEAQLRRLHTPLWQRTLVLFTHADQLGGLSIWEHIWRQGGTLQWLLDRCGQRCQVMSSRSEETRAQVAELLKRVKGMMRAAKFPQEIRTGPSGGGEREGRTRQDTQVDSRWVYPSAGLSGRPAPGRASLLSLVLLGRRRSGKSSAGNLILDRQEFTSHMKTVSCARALTHMLGRSVLVVDTPGWSLHGLADPEQVRAELRRSASLCLAGGSVVFLLTVPVDSFKDKDRRALEEYVGVLGSEVWGSAVVLFTYGDTLRGRTIERHIQKSGEPLQRVLGRCGCRYQVWDSSSGDQQQVKRLLDLVEELMPSTGPSRHF